VGSYENSLQVLLTIKKGELTMKQKMFTKEQYEKLVANHKAQDGSKTFKAVVKLFNPSGLGTWYLSELNPETNEAFGLCCLQDKEYGYVSIDEIKAQRCPPFGLPIERDKFFKSNHYDLVECKELR
jgi:hypothetical protein